jgi:hypothetical protein
MGTWRPCSLRRPEAGTSPAASTKPNKKAEKELEAG